MKQYSKNSYDELIKKILFTISILIVCRFGSYIPIPGIDSHALNVLTQQNQSGILGMLNLLSGGSLGRMSVFALGVMPYITASIILQLLSVALPMLETLKKEGETGRKKINQYTRYLTVMLAAIHAYGVSSGLNQIITPAGPIVILETAYFKMSAMITLSVGTILLMWLGEQINARGIGNGTSLIIFAGIVSSVPSSFAGIFELARTGLISFSVVGIVILFTLLTLITIIFVERAQRKITVQYPKKQVGNKIYGGDTTHMPLKLNTAGVIPPIFASSLLLFPLTIAKFSQGNVPFLDNIAYYLDHGKPLYLLLYSLLIVFFSFFYTAIVFNSEETANNLKKYGAFVPGRRPGAHTSEYFDYVLTRLTVLGSIYLTIICCLPEVIMSKYSISLALSGSSFLILVNVIIDVFTQIQSYLFSMRYEGLVKKMKLSERKI
ncbi:MAG: secY [Rickettsiaceae bacterium]|jgi:preprotein translocase subunit SecY|nr:secY [Rickettsiaceae bacterium]